ncbi:MAG: hypothetical protein KA120_03630 [Candidatus Goldbacteria bacterium]|nr:hypothetical protein [Candidatus Goldiibacteriota bacterium]
MENKIEIKKTAFRLSIKQKAIYNGLLNFGKEPAAFYLDGIKILLSDNFNTKAYLLAHIAREIEGFLRNILVLSKKEKKCIQKGNKKNSHKKEICEALGLDENHEMVKKWRNIKFHKYAHRNNKSLREKEAFTKDWHEFEEVLFFLVGNYLNLANIIDKYLKIDDPDEENIKIVEGLIKNSSRYYYFFINLKKTKWLKKLQEYTDIFNPLNNPEPEESEENPGFYWIPKWSILDYLEYVSNEISKSPDGEILRYLVEIVNNIISYKKSDGKRIENTRTDSSMLKIISKFPNETLNQNMKLYLKFIKETLESNWSMKTFSDDLESELMPRLIKDELKDFIIGIINIVLSKKNVEDKESPYMHYYWLEEMLEKNKKRIAEICGKEAMKITIEKIKSIIDDKQNYWFVEVNSYRRTKNELLDILIAFAAAMLELSNPENIKEIINSLIKEKNNLFNKFAVFAIGCHYNDLSDLFWNNFNQGILENINLKYELYEFFKKNADKVLQDKEDIIIKWIEEFPQGEKLKERKDEKYFAYKKKNG